MYNQRGTFPGEPFKPPRRPWTLLNFLFWATVLLSPLFSFVLGIFASGSPVLILAFLGFVGAGEVLRGSGTSWLWALLALGLTPTLPCPRQRPWASAG